MWSQSAPHRTIRSASDAKFAKSEDSIDGAIFGFTIANLNAARANLQKIVQFSTNRSKQSLIYTTKNFQEQNELPEIQLSMEENFIRTSLSLEFSKNCVQIPKLRLWFVWRAVQNLDCRENATKLVGLSSQGRAHKYWAPRRKNCWPNEIYPSFTS